MKRAAAVLVTAVMIVLTVDFVVGAWRSPGPDRDAYAYYLALERVQHGRTMYQPLPPRGPHVPEISLYLYPPPFAAALSLLPRDWDYTAFARFWCIVVVTAYWSFAAALGKLALGRVTLFGTAIAGALVMPAPRAFVTLVVGQVDVLMWAALGTAFAFPRVAGAGFATAALLKLFPVWTAFAALFRADMRTLRQGALVIAGACAFSAIVLGPLGFLAETRTWLVHVLPAMGQGQVQPGSFTGVPWFDTGEWLPFNLSIPLLPVRLLWDGAGDLPPLVRVYLLIASVAAPLAVAWRGRRWRWETHFLAVLAAALLFAPLCRPSYLVALVPGLAMLYRARRRRAEGDPSPGAGTPVTSVQDRDHGG